MRYGTNYFVSKRAIANYYRCDAAAVARKLAEGLVHVGMPPKIEAGDKISIIPGEGRYQIEERKMVNAIQVQS